MGKGGEGEGTSKQESLDYPCLGFDVFLCFQKMQIIRIQIEANENFCKKNGQISYLIIAADSSNPENTN